MGAYPVTVVNGSDRFTVVMMVACGAVMPSTWASVAAGGDSHGCSPESPVDVGGGAAGVEPGCGDGAVQPTTPTAASSPAATQRRRIRSC